MGFQFIDNQPIRFNSSKFDDQSCINKDASAYNVLMKPGDPLHWQAKLKCCETDNLTCDVSAEGAELVTDGDMSNAAAFTLGAGWAISGGVATFTPGADTFISQVLAISVRPYVVRVEVISNSAAHPIDVFLGSRRIKTIESDVTGIVTIYAFAGVGTSVSIKASNDYSIPTTGTIVIDNLSVKPIAECYTFNTSDIERVNNGTFDGGSAVVNATWSLNTGWSWNAGNFVRHTTPAAVAELDQNIPTTTVNREDYTFSVLIANRTAGTLTYKFGNEAMSVISSNGTTSFIYPAKTLENTLLAFLPAGNFDGDVDDVSMIETKTGWSYDPDNGFCHSPGWANAFYAGSVLSIGHYYKLVVEILVEDGEVAVEAGGVSLGTVTKTGIYPFYFTATATTGERFTPSSDFDGCILDTMDMCKLYREAPQARLVYSDGITGATDWHTVSSSSNPVIVDGEWVTWRVNSLAAILVGGSPAALVYSCYRVQVKVVCDLADPPTVTTTTSDTFINYAASHDCTKLFMSYCNGDALDFNFGYNGNMFRLYSRLRTLYMNPSQPIDADDYEFSSGITRRIYATRKKKYELLFDYADEYAHDVIGTMIVCDFMYIDNVQYIADGKDYEPDWADRGKRNLAQSTIEIMKSDGTIFNRNCS